MIIQLSLPTLRVARAVIAKINMGPGRPFIWTTILPGLR